MKTKGIHLTPVPAEEVPTKKAWIERAQRPHVVIVMVGPDRQSFHAGYVPDEIWRTPAGQLQPDGSLHAKGFFGRGRFRCYLMERL
jgi:hypothetical protein